MSWWTTNNRIHPKAKDKFIVVFGSTFFIPSVKSVGKPKVSFETKEFRLINHKFNYPGNATWEPITIKFVDMNGDINPKQRHEIFDTAAFLWQVMNNTGYRYPYINTSNYKDPVFNNGKDGTTGHWIGTKIDTERSPGGYKYITTPEKSSTIANSFGAGLSGVRDMKAASSAKQRISIYQIDPDGYTVELWHLVNPIVKSIGWGDLDYTSNDLVEYELQVVYDWAILDREAIGKEPEYSGTEYTEFMKTIYVTNQIDINNALEKRIQELRQLDEKLDGTEAGLARDRRDLDAAIMDAKMIVDPGEREQALEDLMKDAYVIDEKEKMLNKLRQEQLEQQESILEEARKIDESLAETLENELRQELNIKEEAFITSQNAEDSLQDELKEEIEFARAANEGYTDVEGFMQATGNQLPQGEGDPEELQPFTGQGNTLTPQEQEQIEQDEAMRQQLREQFRLEEEGFKEQYGYDMYSPQGNVQSEIIDLEEDLEKARGEVQDAQEYVDELSGVWGVVSDVLDSFGADVTTREDKLEDVATLQGEVTQIVEQIQEKQEEINVINQAQQQYGFESLSTYRVNKETGEILITGIKGGKRTSQKINTNQEEE